MKRRSGCGSCLTVLVFIVVLAVGTEILGDRLDRWRFPWGYEGMGHPSLAGIWVGPMTTRSGKRLGMLLEVRMASLSRGRRRSSLIRSPRRNRWFEGRVLTCTGPGRVQHYSIYGAPDDTKTGSRFHLSMSPTDSVPADGLAPSHLKGQWGGADSMDLTVSLYMRKGKSAISSTADPDTGPDQSVTLKRGTDAELNSLCSRL